MSAFLNNLFTLLILLTSWFALGQGKPPNINGTYDPEFKPLYDHLDKAIISPQGSVGDDINGIVYAGFLLDGKGLIIPGSIRIVEGLSHSANLAVVRALKLFSKPLSFGRTDEHGERSCIIPVKFEFKNSNGAQLPSRFLTLPLKTVVVKKEVEVTKVNWKVYAQPGLNNALGEVTPGDSVTVTAWAAHAFFIQTTRLSGYISWNALPHDGNMQQLAQLVDERSAEEEAFEEEARVKREQKELEVIYNYSLSTAHLSLKSNKQKVYVGECATITLAFNVAADNRVGLQFYELGKQIRPFLDTLSTKLNAFNVSANIDNIEGHPEVIDGVEYSSYDIYKGSVCPLDAVPLKLSPAKLKMMIVDRTRSERNKLGQFISKPVMIKVQPLPFASGKSFRPTGNLKAEESLTAENGLVAGEPFLYHFTISGDAVLLPMDPPRPKADGVEIRLENIEDIDTLRDNTLYSRRTFTYKVLALVPGTYSLQNAISVSFFNTSTGKIEKLVSKKIFSVLSGTKPPQPGISERFFTVNHCILFDASTSMQVEDYKPNRLEAVKLGLLEFLNKTKSCDIGIFAFSRYVASISLPNDSGCYDERAIFEQSVLPIQGTAIGNAICLSVFALKPDAIGKKVVVIGDGDNTAGPIGLQFAIDHAKKNNIKVYTIGVGKRGLVPYGIDVHGEPNLIADTFKDKDFQRIAKATGGKYFYAKDAQEVANVLSDIFR
jgi:hypothetical protein